MLPFLVRFSPKKLLLLILGALVIATPVTRGLFYDTAEHGGLMWHGLVFCRSDSLCSGVLAAWAWTIPASWTLITKSVRLATLVFIVTLGGTLYFTITAQGSRQAQRCLIIATLRLPYSFYHSLHLQSHTP